MSPLLHGYNFCTFCCSLADRLRARVLCYRCTHIQQLNLCLLVHVRIINERGHTAILPTLRIERAEIVWGFTAFFASRFPHCRRLPARPYFIGNCCRYLNGIYGRCAIFNGDHGKVFPLLLFEMWTRAKIVQQIGPKRATEELKLQQKCTRLPTRHLRMCATKFFGDEKLDEMQIPCGDVVKSNTMSAERYTTLAAESEK